MRRYSLNTPAGWLFDEPAHAGSEHLDPDYVHAYDHKARVDPTEDLRTLQELGLNRRSSLLDMGAGTGTFALAAARFCDTVVAVDVSPAMLEALASRARHLDVTNVTCVRAGFLGYEHVIGTVDFVYSRNALHHLPDFWKAVALQRTATWLRTGAILLLRDLVFSFDPAEAPVRIEAWLQSAAKSGDEGWTRVELEDHVRREYSTFSWLLEPILERAGFDIRSAEYSASRIFAAYTCVKH